MRRWPALCVLALAVAPACGEPRGAGRARGAAASGDQPSAGAAQRDAAAPVASAPAEEPEPVDVVLTASELLIGPERSLVLALPPLVEARLGGVDPSHKRSGANDLYLVPLAERARALRAARGLPDRATARIEAQADTPYRVLIEVVYTLGQVGFGRWILARPTGAPSQAAPVVVAPYPHEPRAPEASRDVVVQLEARGIRVKTSKGTLAAGCASLAPDAKAATIPLRGEAQDVAVLGDCAMRLRAASPEPGTVTFVAEPATPYAVVVAALDALRGDPRSPGYPLYPNVHLGVPRLPPAEHRPPPPCAQVQIGLDLRALPRNTSSSGIDRFVSAQMSELQRKAGPDAPVRLMYWPGIGLFEATFDASTPLAAMASCQATVAKYLAAAPTLPLGHEPAAHEVKPCAPCE